MSDVPATFLAGTFSSAFLFGVGYGASSLVVGTGYGLGISALVVAGDWIGRSFITRTGAEVDGFMKVAKTLTVIALAIFGLFALWPGSTAALSIAFLPLTAKGAVLWITSGLFIPLTRYVINEISLTLEG